jgi:hypothetical protein
VHELQICGIVYRVIKVETKTEIRMIKKTLGYFLYAFCILFSIALLSAFWNLLRDVLKVFATNYDAYQIGIVIGESFGLTLISIGVFHLWRYSNKLTS